MSLRKAETKLTSNGMTAKVTHEFNNMLAITVSEIAIALKKLSPDSPASAHLQKAAKSLEYAIDLARYLSDTNGNHQLQFAPLPINQLIREDLELLYTKLAQKAQLDVELADNLPSIQVDRHQFRRLFLNLLLNAADSIHNGSGYIKVQTKEVHLTPLETTRYLGYDQLNPGGYVCLQIADNGSGMDSRTLRRIFEPHFTTKQTGTGLGLTISLEIVKNHRGGIQVRSAPGDGTLFHILLPIAHEYSTETG